MKILYVLSALFHVPINSYRARQRLFIYSNSICMIVLQRQMTKAQVAFALLRFLHVESHAYTHSVCVCVFLYSRAVSVDYSE